MTAWWNRVAPRPLPADPLLDRLWAAWSNDVPAAASFARRAGRFGNDHLTLHSLARPGSGVALFARIFERRGWRTAGELELPATHQRAVHLSRDGYPRVYLTELDASALPADARAALLRLPADAPPPDDDDALAAWFKAPLPPSGADLQLLQPASPSGAWLLAFGRRVHHFAASVADIEGWQRRLVALGIELAGDPGEQIVGAPGAPLRLVSTRAVELEVLLRDGSFRPMAFAGLELAERQQGFDGFLAAAPTGASPGREVRRHPRVASALHVELGYGALRVPVVTENVSQGGMFLQLADEDAPAIHSVLQLNIELPTGTIEALATVVYVLPGRGFGVEFQWWDDDASPERRALAAFLSAPR